MAYSGGNLIAANDYMSFRGSSSPAVSYPSDIAATGKVAALIGVGYGQRGYGVTSTTLPGVTANTTVATATVWNNLRSAMSVIDTHTGSGVTLQPVVARGNIIVANDGRPSLVNIGNIIATLDNDRFNMGVGQSATALMLTSTRSTAWTNTLFHEFTVIFGVEDQARYFFNSGGKIRFVAARDGGTAGGVNTVLTSMLSSMGQINFSAINTTYTGTGGTSSSIGYYNLTGTYQTVFTAVGSGAFPNISYSVLARRENFTGQNGGNGSLLRFRAFFDISNYISEIADGNLSSSISSVRSIGAINAINPTFATIVNL